MGGSQYGSIAVQGLYNSEVSFSSNITTTSTATSPPAIMTGMTMTPPAGSYLVIFSTWLTESNGNTTVSIGIVVGGTLKADSVRTTVPFCGALGAVNSGIQTGTNGIVTVNGSQAIAIGWAVSAGTATAHDGTFNIIKIG
jgi:hypothetical protein